MAKVIYREKLYVAKVNLYSSECKYCKHEVVLEKSEMRPVLIEDRYGDFTRLYPNVNCPVCDGELKLPSECSVDKYTYDVYFPDGKSQLMTYEQFNTLCKQKKYNIHYV